MEHYDLNQVLSRLPFTSKLTCSHQSKNHQTMRANHNLSTPQETAEPNTELIC